MLAMPFLPPSAPVILALVFMAGHAKPSAGAQVKVSQPPSTIQLAERETSREGQWIARLSLRGGTYDVTAHVRHAVCSSLTLMIPPMPNGQIVGGLFRVRIYCEPEH
jgi:hypothetical protein